MKTPKDMAASVRQRLLNRSRDDKRPFAEVLQYYAMERFHIVRPIQSFLSPIATALYLDREVPSQWNPAGPWAPPFP